MKKQIPLSTEDFGIAQETQPIENLIFEIRGRQVMLDRDLAMLYGVETKRLNEQVRRNIERFPEDFMFQLNNNELNNWKSQIATSNSVTMGLRKRPYAFTENGVAMLSSVLRSPKAIEVNIQIKIETDKRVDDVFRRLEAGQQPQQGIFFDGQVFDAYHFVCDLVRTAKNSIVLFDNYIDDSVLSMLDKRNDNVSATIYTKNIAPQLTLDIQRHNAQYDPIDIFELNKVHDRFLCIDDTVYHIGASLKDLGKKWFAFAKMEIQTGLLVSNI